MTSIPAAPPALTLAPHSFRLSLLLHLGPGAAAAAVYFALVPVVHGWGLPSVAALALSGLLGVAPVQLGVLALHRRRHREAGRPEPAVWLRGRTPLGRLVAWTAVVVLAAGIVFAAMAPLAARVESTVFGWWPESLKVDLASDGDYGRPALLVTAALLLVGTVVVSPVVEELYFRGFLLPRMSPGLGAAAPVTHALLFAAYHVWTPWLILTRTVAILPLVYAVRRTRDVRVGIAAHLVLNAADLVVVSLAVAAV